MGKTEAPKVIRHRKKDIKKKNSGKPFAAIWKANHGTEVVSNSREVEGEHPKKIKKLPKPVNIPAKNLFTIASSNLALKNSNLIEPNIPPLANL